jgi:LysM repeat protein
MTTADVMALNNMSSERVRRGDNIKVKAPTHYNASADNDEIIAVTSDSNSQGSNDLALNEQQDGQTEQDQFDEVKDIEREAATKAPYKGSYTVNVDDNDTKTVTKKSTSAKADDQVARQQAAKSNTSNWRSRNAKYAEKETTKSSRNSGRNESTYKGSHSSKKKNDDTASSKGSKSRRSKKASKPEQPSEVTVQKGESLTKIAEKAGVTVKDIERANGIEDGNKIKAGDKIKIPTKAEAKQAEKKSKSKSGKSGKGSSTEKSSKKSSGKASKESSSKSSKSSSGKSGKSGSKKSKKK